MKLDRSMSMADVEKIAIRAAKTARRDEIKRVFYATVANPNLEDRFAVVEKAAYNRVLRDYHDLFEPDL